MSKTARSIIIMTLLAIPMIANADVISWDLSYAQLPGSSPDPISLLTVPDGSGDLFTAAHLLDGTIADATITLTLLTEMANPIADFPHEDIWLAAIDGGLVECTGGTNPDQNTDANGQTFWNYPLRAGGYSMDLIQVFVVGDPLLQPGLNLYINSPDINGDLAIDLIDVGLFSADNSGTYHYRSDLMCDGIINLADVGKLAAAVGAECP